jgi:pyruvate kinase
VAIGADDPSPAILAARLSSLGRSEGHVQASVSAVLNALTALALRPPVQSSPAPVVFAASRKLLATRTAALLGPMRPGRPTRIMVAMPAQAGRDPGLVAQMLAAGMDCARINCAHDAASDWRGMLDNVRRAELRTQRRFASWWTFRARSCEPGRASRLVRRWEDRRARGVRER